MIPPLPTEIKDEIVNHLHDDRKALLACSLATTALLAPARHHLFSEVSVECAKLCTFLALLDASWCSISPALTRMSIHGPKGFPMHDSTPVKGYVSADRMRLISRLQGISRIRFSCLAFCKISPFWRLLSDLKAVRELEFHKLKIGSPVTFFQYICSIPGLAALSITESSMPTIALDMTQFRRVTTLSIPLLDVTKASGALLDWFQAQDTIPHVQTFSINLNSSSTGLLTTRKYTDAIGPSVHNLHIRLPSSIKTYLERPGRIDFTPFIAVRSIHFEGHIGQESHALETFMRGVFEKIPSPVLTDVSLTVSLELADEALAAMGVTDQWILEAFNWGRLPDILEDRIGTNLRELRLIINGYPAYWITHVKLSLKAGPFAMFHRRGVFHVDFAKPFIGAW
ncbi:hypothetical protein BDZ94DRAFT_1271937 [Collybia nuda]|uniref:Uncharacterized protein n=1 Tax=Collybia nuda TaxID=64659 RepID=A0A9P5XUP7_9AGAR|nr:hypothetical protein BDZ94DRAFT_1271937 [Collybia nuda]